jgi:hypothetical protein
MFESELEDKPYAVSSFFKLLIFANNMAKKECQSVGRGWFGTRPPNFPF